MAETVGQHSVAAFTSPVNGTTPIDANTVRGNDNTVRSAYVDHDADPGIHVQSSTLASRPVAGTAGRKWITVSSGRYQLWYDDGSRWNEVASDAINVDCLADTALTKGDVVKITGFNNGQNLPTVAKVSASTDTAFGLVENTVSSGAIVQIINTGLIEDVDTNGYAVGTVLYPNTSGGWTTTKPTSGNYQPAGYVLRGNTNTGVLYVEFSAPRIVERSDNTASTIVLRDASGNFAAGTITAGALTSTGLVTFASLKGTGATTVTNILDEDNMASDSATALATQQSIKAYVDAKVATVDTLAEVLANGNTTGANNIIVSTGQKIQTPTIAAFDNTTAISIANSTGALTLASALADSNLATISTAGKVANSATTATALNTSSAIVARDSSGNFAAGTITANLTGNISGTAPAGTLTGTTLASNVVSSSLTSVGTLSSLTVSGQANLATTSGTVGIGATSSAKLNVQVAAAGVSGRFTDATNSTLQIDHPSSGTLRFRNGADTAWLTENGGNVSLPGALTVTGDLTVDTSTLKVDSTNNRVGIGTASPTATLHVEGASTNNIIAAIGQTGYEGVLYLSGAGSGKDTSIVIGNGRNLNFKTTATATPTTSGTTAMTLDGSGNLAVDTNTLYVDAANNAVGIGTSNPNAYGTFVVSGSSIPAHINASSGVSGVNLYENGSGRFSLRTLNGTAGIAFYDTSASVERARIDASGNLGLGVTPSAWATYRALQVVTASLYSASSGNDGNFSSNAYYDGSVHRYVNAATATRYQQTAGQHRWFNAPAGANAGDTITFTQAMTLDASGRLGIGTTGYSSSLAVVQATTPTDYSTVVAMLGGTGASSYAIGANHLIGFNFDNSAHRNPQAALGYQVTDNAGSTKGALVFATRDVTTDTAPTERARITSEGYFKASNDGTYVNAAALDHEIRQTLTNANLLVVSHTAASPYGPRIYFSGASPDNNSNYFLLCDDSTTARCYIWSDGDLANHDGVYGTISDERLKQDIVDASSQWDDLKAIRFRKYRMKTDVEANPDAPAMLGVVAQELELVSPGLVDEHPNEDGTTTKSVKSSILLMKAAVALQEAMARIEALEARLAVLEA